LKAQLEEIIDDSILDYTSCLKMWKYIANNGDTDLQYQLGKIFEEMGSEFELMQAKEWYSKAANCSHGPSLFRLGRLFEQGIGVEQDYKKAIELYEKSAKTGNNNALCALGAIYQHGKGVNLDISTSVSYYLMAAENGDNKAQFNLGTLCERGEIEYGDVFELFKWFSLTASQGNEEAYSRLDTYDDHSDGQFHTKLIRILYKLIKQEKNTNRPDHFFFGQVYYRLGCLFYYGSNIHYRKAWEYFKLAYQVYGETRAAIFLKIDSRQLDPTVKEEYLKRLEMWESVVSHLKKEEIYELGMIYRYGVYENISRSDEAIVEPDAVTADNYFRMVSGIELSGIYISSFVT
jgi:TPR repeat protein